MDWGGVTGAGFKSLFHKSDAAKVVDYWVPVYADVNALFAVLQTTLS